MYTGLPWMQLHLKQSSSWIINYKVAFVIAELCSLRENGLQLYLRSNSQRANGEWCSTFKEWTFLSHPYDRGPLKRTLCNQIHFRRGLLNWGYFVWKHLSIYLYKNGCQIVITNNIWNLEFGAKKIPTLL